MRVLALVVVVVGCRGDYDASDDAGSSTSSSSADTSTSSSSADTSTSSSSADTSTSSSSADTSTSSSSTTDTGPACVEPYGGPCEVLGDDCCEGVCYQSAQGGGVTWCASPCSTAEDCPEPEPPAVASCVADACVLQCSTAAECPPASTCNGYACGW